MSDPIPAADRHLAPLSLARLRSGDLDTDTIADEVVPHLLARCPGCAAAHTELRWLTREVGHCDEVLAATEGVEAPELWDRLSGSPYSRQIEVVETDETYHSWALCRLLVKRSGMVAEERPETAAQWANLALRISTHLDATYDLVWVRDLRALAFAALGDGRRVLGELLASQDAFDAARTQREAGTGDPWIEAQTLASEAVLRRDQRRLGDAVALLDRVLAIVGAPGWEPPDAGVVPGLGPARLLLLRAWCLYHLGHREAAPPLLAEAASKLDATDDPLLPLLLRCGLVWSALALGQVEEAAVEAAAAVELAGRLGIQGQASRLRLRRAEARIHLARGERGPAEQALLDAARDLLRAALGVDAALAWLDLAALYLEEGAGEAIANIAAESLALFASPDIGREEMHGLLFFRQAWLNGNLTGERVAEVARALETTRRPSLAWWSGWGAVLEGETSDAGPHAAG